MKVPSTLTVAATTLALGLAPAAAIAQGTPGSHGKSQSTSASTRAYGRYCQGQSKKHVAGQKGTPFSNCVTDMAHLAKSPKSNPATVCASNEIKRHVAGQKGTPYSDCVSAAAKLRGHHS